MSFDVLEDRLLNQRTASTTTPSNKRQPTTARETVTALFPSFSFPLLLSFFAPLVGVNFDISVSLTHDVGFRALDGLVWIFKTTKQLKCFQSKLFACVRQLRSICIITLLLLECIQVPDHWTK